jgi:CRP/FNR family transcriptional regulator, cyclic AMP receptor protein
MSSDLRTHLRNIPLFCDLDEEALQLLAHRCQRRKFPAKTALFHEGDPGLTLYVIVSGRVNIERTTGAGETVHIAKMAAGDHFGEFSLVDEKPRSATAVTETACEIVVLHRPEFVRCVEKHPSIAFNIIKTLVAHLRESADRTVRYRSLDVLGRLSAYLLEAVAVGKPASAGGIEIERATEVEIAARIGATRESVNRKLAYLRSIGVVTRVGRRLVVLAPDALRSLSSN